MKKEIRKNVLIFLLKEDFKSMAIYLNYFGLNESEDYFKGVFNNLKNRNYLKGSVLEINKAFMSNLNYFGVLQ